MAARHFSLMVTHNGTMSAATRNRVIVHGRVQGVGFRISAQMRADELGVTGFVSNRPDRTVEAEIEGTQDAVNTMIDWLRGGPVYARVTDVEIESVVPQHSSSFSILP